MQVKVILSGRTGTFNVKIINFDDSVIKVNRMEPWRKILIYLVQRRQ